MKLFCAASDRMEKKKMKKKSRFHFDDDFEFA